ncbi:MAG TPA: phage portal protein [Gemmatimonadales bacterium]|nr:phage portal protein [Gemmatimonadales bacterium]
MAKRMTAKRGGTSRKRRELGTKWHDLERMPPFYDLAAIPQTLPGSQDTRWLDANVVMSPVMWIMRLFIGARPVVERRLPERGEEVMGPPVWQQDPEHPLAILLDQPNPFYDGDVLWQATVLSYVPNGNAYWRKVRNGFDEVVELWYLPHWLVRPRYPTDGSSYIDYYEYRSGPGEPERIPVRDIVHFRFGLDPRDTRLGLSPLGTLLREVFTDDEAAIFSAAILHKMGIPGLVISPKDKTSRPSVQDVEELTKYLSGGEFRGTQRGATLVLGTPTDVVQFGFDPNKLMLGSLRDISEERVCAALGLPAAVVGFGSGMQSTKVGATMRELVKMSWVGCLSPIQQSLAKQLSRQLLPDFVSQRRRFRIRFDTSEVEGFHEDENQVAERVARLVTAGILRVDRAQAMLGLEVDKTQQIYLRPSNSLPVDADGNPIREAAPPGAVTPGTEDVPPALDELGAVAIHESED